MRAQTSVPLRLYQQIANQIAELITRKHIKIGQRLPPERDLAIRLKVSRPVVREALVALELAGTIEVRTGSGAYVRPPDPKRPAARSQKLETGPSAFELINARKLIEPAVTAQAALRRTDKDLAGIENALRLFERHWQGTHWETLEADRVFHLEIAKAAHNDAILRIVGGLWADMFGPIFAVLSERTNVVNKKLITKNDHRTIFGCIERGDAMGAEAAMHAHLVHAEMKMLESGNARKPNGRVGTKFQ
jgi:DNA-binding FadR family transcriptional regulator